ncbi:MAG: carbohydrate ABC transporter permease [Chloroflexi bacterium]|jgi:ABC-type glycerol-3-phosphate transport system permease component|uniref:Carbohydrate ABC transporter permease n=1 Tax=Candidatus Chlorohelix allophototropha TaxID=3003348 RepID=A0A8T7M446_9CHLR|nr:carbohydrate ABC transporter permease [Chloroflexota bacterium]WJW70166.1 carbohydrate ABC transporter permease [Chloroflexota bacterium L227-S17]
MQLELKPNRKPFRKYAGITGFYLGVAFIVVAATVPFLWLIITSFKTSDRVFKKPPDLLPSPPTFDSYINVFQGRNFGQNIWNSFVAASLTTLGCLLIGTFAGYVMGRINFPGRRFLLGVVLAVSMFPGIAIIGPLYLLFSDLKLINQIPALVLPYVTFNLPLTVWLLAAFFRDLPGELEEAAEVDGAHPFTAFYRVMLPLAVPGIVTAAILIFINAWNDFLFANTFMNKDSTFTAPVAISQFTGVTESSEPWDQISAGAVIVTIPLVLLVLLFQRRIISGLTSGAVKG